MTVVRVLAGGAVAALLLGLSGCTPATPPTAPTTSASTATASPTASPSRPVAVHGVTDPRVTQATIATTICVPGWSTARRREGSYGMPPRTGYVRDDVIPIELGGLHVKANIAYVPRARSLVDDREENRLHRAVCARPPLLTLAAAQREILEWKSRP